MRVAAFLKSTAGLIVLGAMPASALAQNSNLTSLTASQAFPAWQSTIKYQIPTSGPNAGKPTSFGNYAKVTASVRYDAATQSYIVRDTGSTSITSTFAPAHVVSSTPVFTNYQKTSGSTTETLRLFKPGPGNTTMALTYTSYGHWRRTTPNGGFQGATAVNDTYFVYGIKTAGNAVPRTGSANYSTVYDGTFTNKNAIYDVNGTGLFTANFGTGKISYSAALTATGTGPALAFGPLSGTGNISFNAASFSGNPDALNPNYKLSMSGYFFGPTAQEVGAVFRLTGGGGNGQGAMVGKQ